MSLKKIEQVKADKGFRLFDLIIYGAIAAIVVVLFIVIFVTRDTSPLRGISVRLGNNAVFEYDFENGKYSDYDENIVVINEDTDENLVITVYSDGGYNKISINKSGKVKVVEADCRHKDCKLPTITDNNTVIHCMTHSLIIEPYGFDVDNDIIIPK